MICDIPGKTLNSYTESLKRLAERYLRPAQ